MNSLRKQDLINFFHEIGVESGMLLELHVNFETIGKVLGGAQTFVDALLEVLGYNGTLVMNMPCLDNQEPSYLKDLELEDYRIYRNEYPAYLPANSELSTDDCVLENVRRRDKAVFTSHPNHAFVAIGKYAKLLCNYQKGDFGLDELSPLGRMYELKASCLLMGSPYSEMTSLYLSQYKAESQPIILNGSSVNKDGYRTWHKYLDFALSNAEFDQVGEIMERRHLVTIANLNDAVCRLLRIDIAVDQGISYFNEKYKYYR